MVKIRWAESARKDLRSIHAYIAHDSVNRANHFRDRLVQRVGQLHRHPRSGRVVPEFSSEALRELIEGSYRIIYQLNGPDMITVIRVHHSSMNI